MALWPYGLWRMALWPYAKLKYRVIITDTHTVKKLTVVTIKQLVSS